MNKTNFELLHDLVLEKYIAEEICCITNDIKHDKAMDELRGLDRSNIIYYDDREYGVTVYRITRIKPYFGIFKNQVDFYITRLEDNGTPRSPKYVISHSLLEGRDQSLLTRFGAFDYKYSHIPISIVTTGIVHCTRAMHGKPVSFRGACKDFATSMIIQNGIDFAVSMWYR